MFKQLSLIGTAMHSYDEFLDAIEFINKEKIEPVISDVLPIEDYEKGFEQMKNHQQFGKIVFTIS
jgi:zinc-binding alcohol dehydrogenase/oxidoreductase